MQKVIHKRLKHDKVDRCSLGGVKCEYPDGAKAIRSTG